MARHRILWLRNSSVATLLILAYLIILGSFSGCGVSHESDHRVSARAILDWEAATITLPLDAFGMTSGEQRLARAAQSLVWAKCVLGTEVSPESAVKEARRALGARVPDPDATHWLFGVWNRAFVAKHGWMPFPSGPPSPQLVTPATRAVAHRCARADDFLALATVSPSGSDSIDPLLLDLSLRSFNETLIDSAYARLATQRASCITGAGLPVDSSAGLAQVRRDTNWSNDQTLKAMLVEAECDDSLSFTQNAANLTASRQVLYISQNRDALEKIRSAVIARVGQARALLNDAGVQA